MIILLQKALNRFFRPRNCDEYDYVENKKYLNIIGTPRDDIERSFFQYKCQMHLAGIWRRLILNAGAFWILILILLKLKKQKDTEYIDNNCAVFYSPGLDNAILPDLIIRKYPEIISIHEMKARFLDNDCKMLLKEMFRRHPFSFYFLAKTVLKLSIYCGLLINNPCRAIIASCEYSFTSSVLTRYCNLKGIEHINIMHGEKLFDITDSFFHFNVCCIWDKYYEELFETLRARIDEYIIDIPNSFFYKKVTYERETVNYKYYLQRETKEQLQKIYGYLLALKSEGNCVMVRPHPLYSDSNQIKKLFSDIEIENPQTVDIKESILTTEAVISHYSTVLFQAYLNGIDVIIDNCSSSDNQCERLRSLGYIMMHLKHRCLKDILIGINAKRYNEKSN